MRRLWQFKGAELVTSGCAVAEARRNLETKEQRDRLETLLVAMRMVGESEEPELPPGVTLRHKDIPILCAAIAATASHLLTLDLRDFRAYLGKSVQGVVVLHPRDYQPAKTRVK